MKCEHCPSRKKLDAIDVMEGAPDWMCDIGHTETEDVVCLLRMIVWQLSHLEDILNED